MAIDLGIDLGTSSVLVYKNGEGLIIKEPSVIVLDRTNNKIVAVGEEAEEMLGRTPSNLVAIKPLKNGVISNFDMTEKVLRYFISKAINKKGWKRPRVSISIPSQSTELEKKAVEEAAIQAGARGVELVEAPIAAAIGLGLDINKPIGNMIVDIGGATTDIAVISLGGIVESSTISIGGEDFNKAIVNYIRKKHNVLIGMSVAESIKKQTGSCVSLTKPNYVEIRGRNLNNGLISTAMISSNDIAGALRSLTDLIIREIHYILENTKPELASDITYRGIVLCGGGANLFGIDELIEKSLGIATVIATNPDEIIVEGVAKYFDIKRSGR